MSTEREAEERARLAHELRALRDTAREQSPPDRPLPPPRPVTAAPALPRLEPPPVHLPTPPSGDDVNAFWEARPAAGGKGARGWIGRLLYRLLAPWHEAQVAFNSRQVQLDNALLGYLDQRFAATHRHYDAILGGHGQRLQDVDERHVILQEELVAHVHDLVRRIDLVLSEAERGRLGVENELRALKERVRALEERLTRR